MMRKPKSRRRSKLLFSRLAIGVWQRRDGKSIAYLPKKRQTASAASKRTRMSKKGGQERIAMADTYETFRQTIEAKWLAGQHSGNLIAERLYEKVLFRLVDLPEVAHGTHDVEVRAWYEGIVREFTSMPELRDSPGGRRT